VVVVIRQNYTRCVPSTLIVFGETRNFPNKKKEKKIKWQKPAKTCFYNKLVASEYTNCDEFTKKKVFLFCFTQTFLENQTHV